MKESIEKFEKWMLAEKDYSPQTAKSYKAKVKTLLIIGNIQSINQINPGSITESFYLLIK